LGHIVIRNEPAMLDVWYVRVGSRAFGPLTQAELKAAAAAGRFGRDAMLCRGGTDVWIRARSVSGLNFPDSTARVSQPRRRSQNPANSIARLSVNPKTVVIVGSCAVVVLLVACLAPFLSESHATSPPQAAAIGHDEPRPADGVKKQSEHDSRRGVLRVADASHPRPDTTIADSPNSKRRSAIVAVRPVTLAAQIEPRSVPAPPQPEIQKVASAKNTPDVVLLAECRTLLTQLHQRRKQLLAKRDSLKQASVKLERDSAALRTTIAPFDARGAVLRNELAEIQSQIDDLRYQRASPQRRHLLLALADRKNEIAKIEAESAPLLASLSKISQEIASRKQEWDSLPGQADQLRVEWLRIVDPLATWTSGDNQQALAILTEWIGVDDDFPLAYACRGLAERGLELRDKATQDFGKALKLDPKCPEALAAQALVLHANGDRSGANKLFDRARRLAKDSAFVAVCRGLSRRSQKDYRGAISEFRRGSRQFDSAAHALLALTLATCPDDRLRDGKSAVTYAMKACEATAWKRWWYIDVLAAAHAEAGDFHAALECVEKARELAGPGQHKGLDERAALYKSGKPLRL
jgi:tetratricopeptide (TPR) repeat protein